MRFWKTNPFNPVTLVRGQGCTVWDTSGKSYLDLHSGTWCAVLGHGHPKWLAAVQEQTTKLTHTGASFLSTEIEEALTKLKQILPHELNRAVFLNTGSEAVEMALKIACSATGSDGIFTIEGSYYGATTFALALSEAGRTAGYLPSIGHIYRLPTPNCKRCTMGQTWPCDDFPCLNALAQWAEKNKHRAAAILYEPVMEAGIIVPPIGYCARLRTLASQFNILLIAEEVTTGMGRTGHWFAFEHDNIVPDILVIGKAIGAGLPVSVVVTTSEVEKRSQKIMGRHVQSHQNDPFSGRIVSAVISILQEEQLVERAAEQGAYLLTKLKELQLECLAISEVRGRGIMVGVELHPDVASKGAEIAKRLLEIGFIIDFHSPTATFRLFPPYVISNEEIDGFTKAFKQVLSEVISNCK